MKNKLTLCMAMLAFTFSQKNSTAQTTKFSEGKIVFEITYPESNLDERTMAMLPSGSDIFVKEGMSRMEMKGGPMSQVVIGNSKTGTSTMLMDMMGKKYAIKIDKTKDKTNGKLQFKYLNETKTIAGYNCKKAEVTDTSTHNTTTVWFTKDIVAKYQSRNVNFEGLDGFPMEFTIAQQGITMKMMVKSIEKMKVNDSQFEIPKEYTVTTMEDLKKGMGAGGE